MLNSLQKRPEQLGALAQVREWTRARFDLPEDAAILVSEIACGLPGCPPIETVVAFWTTDATRHQFKIFKSVQKVVQDDLPFAWLKDALAAPEGLEYGCC
jgi:nitrate reductase delta subunit